MKCRNLLIRFEGGLIKLELFDSEGRRLKELKSSDFKTVELELGNCSLVVTKYEFAEGVLASISCSQDLEVRVRPAEGIKE